ncbi:hypothetical protein [Candidatus Symbiopectobacterium sp. NZEC135]|nr:hypothetical protein [Candidatus Symbiopectobacterium sp. NZEC135]
MSKNALAAMGMDWSADYCQMAADMTWTNARIATVAGWKSR